MRIWKFLHIAAMFGAFTVGVGGGLLSHHVIRSGDVEAIRRVLPAWDRIGNAVGIPLFVLGIAFGVVYALGVGFDLTEPWLVIAYVLVGAIILHGFLVYDPHLRRMKAAAVASSAETPSAELLTLIGSPRMTLAFAFEVVLWISVIATMVLKPFS